MTAPGITDLLRRLVEAHVDFVVIGGVAVIAQAYPRFTKDLDITFSPDVENLERLGTLLIELRARLRGLDEDLPFLPDAGTLRRIELLTLDTDAGPLDLLGHPPGARPYAELRAAADQAEIDDFSFAVASIDDLLDMKRAAARPQDLIDIDALETARRLRGEAG